MRDGCWVRSCCCCGLCGARSCHVLRDRVSLTRCGCGALAASLVMEMEDVLVANTTSSLTPARTNSSTHSQPQQRTGAWQGSQWCGVTNAMQARPAM